MTKDTHMGLKVSKMRGQPITEHAHFAMLELQALEGMSNLISRVPKAAQLLVTLIRRMTPGSSGVVVISRETMRELMGTSLPTVDRALKLLIAEGWVQRIRIGGAHALAINRRVAWIGPRGQLQHAVFDATVVASRSEQDQVALNPPPLRKVPMLRSGEIGLPVGPGLEPPSQQCLNTIQPTIEAGNARECEGFGHFGQYKNDTESKELSSDMQTRLALEKRGQYRIEDW